ncbi:selenocysteine-specific translation elongation factor [Ectothiorhodospiraceae bacterium WFHF3C12]|nr:selenocysteine-specific translation elongation factor [Ectothiorhodospiraceae bacterium WFHF3C12]
MIVATAGHVDHGKTRLIRALTGVDTDRLEEEKRRGLSVDVGFAYADLGGDRLLGFVDVPGHERFLRNMLAGLAAIDYALLVVAADDGPMPQTREHLAILDLLGVRRGAVAITKIDRVPPSRVREVERAAAALLAPTGLSGAAMFPVASGHGEGVGALRAHLLEAEQASRMPEPRGAFRLAVDRSFILDGVGRVVTGVVLSGTARPDDTLIVSPAGIRARLRGIHAHNRPAEAARAGQRCALNLAGQELDGDKVLRGAWVVSPALHEPTARIDTRLRVLATESRPLAHWTPVHVHLGAAAVTGRVAPLESRALAPGSDGLVQLVLDRPVQVSHGDRFVIRDQSARRTIGGGSVIDPFGLKRGRGRPQRLSQLEAMRTDDPRAAFGVLLGQSPGGVWLERFAQTYNLAAEERETLLQSTEARTVKGQDGVLAIGGEHWETLCARLLDTLEAWHAEYPESRAMPEAMVSARLGRDIPDAAVRAAGRALQETGDIERDGFGLRLAGHQPVLAEADQALLSRFRHHQADGGPPRPPNIGNLATEVGLAPEALVDRLERLTRLGHLERLGRNRYLTPEAVVELAGVALALAAESEDGTFDTAAYRDRSGIGRNHTVKVLEHLDRLGITRFGGGRRSISLWARSDGPGAYATVPNLGTS